MKYIALALILFGFLTLQTSAQSILKDGKIPKDLAITLSLSSTIEFSNAYDLKITADGKVYLDDRSNLPPLNPAVSIWLNSKSKKPKLKDKLSKKQIKQIISEFEKSGFFEMNDSYYGDPNLKENVCTNHADIKGLSFSANGKTKKVVFFLGCSYGEQSPLKRFLNLYDKIGEIMKGVKKEKLESYGNE